MKAYFKSPVIEIFLAQIIIYLILWLSDNYLATLVSVLFTFIFMAILIISLISEWLSETTPVPRKYFEILIVTILAPIVSAIIAVTVIGINFGI